MSRNSNKNVKLEFVRGIAALLVLVCHLFILFPKIQFQGSSAISNWGTESVIIFFILSGIVINLSIKSRPKSALEFIRERYRRIYPQFFISVCFSIFAWWLVKGNMPGLSVVIGNLLMLDTLQCHIVCPIPSNSALWSLSFEMAFYILFSLTLIFQIDRRYWFLIALAFLPFYFTSFNTGIRGYFISIISFSAIWLVGYFIYEYRHFLSSNIYLASISVSLLPLISRCQLTNQYYDPFKYLLFALASIPFFGYCIKKTDRKNIVAWAVFTAILYLVFILITGMQHERFSNAQWMYTFLPILFPLIIFFVRSFSPSGFSKLLRSTSLFTGKISYSVYIIHCPILLITSNYFNSGFMYLSCSILLVLLVAYTLEYHVQPLIYTWLKK